MRRIAQCPQTLAVVEQSINIEYNPGMRTPYIPNSSALFFTPDELQALGAAVWAALEDDTSTLHQRFFPNEQANPTITKDVLNKTLYDLSEKLRGLGVDMG